MATPTSLKFLSILSTNGGCNYLARKLRLSHFSRDWTNQMAPAHQDYLRVYSRIGEMYQRLVRFLGK
jgi:hypothetical protein